MSDVGVWHYDLDPVPYTREDGNRIIVWLTCHVMCCLWWGLPWETGLTLCYVPPRVDVDRLPLLPGSIDR